ncbi:MAG: XRE family transcriptional regulator [Patescibacteria group bacterium]|nr:XRE family transcriptional regulator [Patescibacteria group bacterium]MDD4610406.1 XRE family transcriptional regulator [Patescibacteria group bacterium]
MLKKINRIYISGALTHASDKQRLIYEKLAEICQTFCDVYVPHKKGTDPINNPEITPSEVWRQDHREVATADLIIAYVGEPSLGTGGELEIARITNSDIILWNFKGQKVSRMALGNPAVIERIEVENEDDLLNKILITIKAKYFN